MTPQEAWTAMLSAKLHAAIATAAPIVGISIGRRDDKATWRIDFAPEATDAQRAAAQSILAGFDPDAASAADVKAEAQRRIIALTDATDLQSCLIKQLNANMRANELNDKRISGDELSPEEVAEAAALRAFAESIKAVRARSNEIEAMTPIPADFAADEYWA